MFMKTHSANDTTSMYLGTSLVNGQLCHRWLDGTVLPVLFGASEDDAGGDDGGDDGDGDGDEDDDDSDKDGDDDDAGDDDGDDPKSKKASARIHRLSRESAKYRNQRNSARQERDAERQAHQATKTELDTLKKSGVNDDTVKAQLAALTERAEKAEAELKTVRTERAQAALESSVQEHLDELDIDCEADVALSRLRKNGITPDDDGEIEDLESHLKKLLKKGVFKKKAASDDGDDDAKSGSSSGGQGATRSGRPVKRSGSKRDGKFDKAALAKKYPALRQ